MSSACRTTKKTAYDGGHRTDVRPALQSRHDRSLRSREELMRRHSISAGARAALWLCAAAALLPGCSPRPAEQAAALTPPFLDTPLAPRPVATAATIAKGKQVY